VFRHTSLISTTKTGRPDIAEILLKVALSTKYHQSNQTLNYLVKRLIYIAEREIKRKV
jgi:hypothetical protein